LNKIPQIQPWIDEEELEEITNVVRSTYITENAATELFEDKIKQLTGAKFVVSMTNGTVALYAILKASGIGPGDEVIVPDMTFVATANAVILAGAKPIFCDVDPITCCIDSDKAEAMINNHTKAIIPVHLYGLGADIDNMVALCQKYEILLIEDAAQGVGVKYRHQHVGTFGKAGILSFYGNKTITTGEGGVVLTDDPILAEECYKLKNHGRREKGIFIHESIGFNFSFTDLQAAIGVAQLNKLERIIHRKKIIHDYYFEHLNGIDAIRFQFIPEETTTPVFWFTNIYIEDLESLVQYLDKNGIGSRRYFYPLHKQPCYSDMKSYNNPISMDVYLHGLSLPSSVTLTDSQLSYIVQIIKKFYK